MKSSSKVLTILVSLAVVSASASAKAGGNGSHGGNTELSTQDQVRDAIHAASIYLPGLLWHWAARSQWVTDARARDMVLRITATTRYKSLADRKNPPFILLESDSCMSDAKKKNVGSAAVGKTSEKFCLSVPEIQRIPPLSLNEQVGPLIGHELAHQAGYGEDDARYFQNFLLGVYKHASEFRGFQRLLDLANLAAYDLDDGLRLGRSSAAVCLATGKLRTIQKLLEDYDRTTTPIFPRSLGSRAVNPAGVVALEDFCTRDAPAAERPAMLKQVGDLLEGLKKAEAELHSLTSSVTLITEIPIFTSEDSK